MSRVRDYTVVKSQMITPSTLMVLLQDEKKRLPLSYQPGQYAAISFIHSGRPTPARCFSITSSPTEQGYLQFAMRVNGDFTSSASHNLVPGAKVIVEGPFGSCVLNADRDKSVILLAGGIGVTPFISMLRYANELHLPNDVLLVYSCRTQDDIPFLEELILLQQTNPHLHIVFVLASGPQDKLLGQSVIQGRVNKALLEQITSGIYKGRTYFVCGPPSFMKGISKTLADSGAPAESVFTEEFSQGQRRLKGIRHNIPLQVYALTGISLVLGATTLLVKDASEVVATPTTESQQQPGTSSGTTNSRQSTVAQALNTLQGNSNTSGAANTSGQTQSQPTVSSSSPSSSSPKQATTSTPSSTQKSGTTSGSTSPTKTTTSSGGSSSSKTPTPAPKPTPVAPSLTLSASSTAITSGKSVTLTWSINTTATSPVTCAASSGWSGSKATSGSQSVSPTTTTTYTLKCSNSAGASSKSVTVTVQPACVSTASNPC